MSLAPPDWSLGDLDGQGGWSKDTSDSLQIVANGTGTAYAGSDATAETSTGITFAAVATATELTFTTTLNMTTNVDGSRNIVFTADDGGTQVIQLVISWDSGSVVMNYDLWTGGSYNSGTFPGVGPAEDHVYQVKVTDDGGTIELLLDGVSILLLGGLSLPSPSTVDHFWIDVGNQGVNEWFGTLLSLVIPAP